MGTFSILLSSKPAQLDLKVTSNLVHMRGHGGGRPKLGGVVAFSVHCATAETLSLNGNGSKWRPLGRRSALYNRAQRRNGRPHLEVYLVRITAIQLTGALNGSIAQRHFPA
jgi:hypothetical protein